MRELLGAEPQGVEAVDPGASAIILEKSTGSRAYVLRALKPLRCGEVEEPIRRRSPPQEIRQAGRHLEAVEVVKTFHRTNRRAHLHPVDELRVLQEHLDDELHADEKVVLLERKRLESEQSLDFVGTERATQRAAAEASDEASKARGVARSGGSAADHGGPLGRIGDDPRRRARRQTL